MKAEEARILTKDNLFKSKLQTREIKDALNTIKWNAENGRYSCEVYNLNSTEEVLKELGYIVSDKYTSWGDKYMKVSWE